MVSTMIANTIQSLFQNEFQIVSKKSSTVAMSSTMMFTFGIGLINTDFQKLVSIKRRRGSDVKISPERQNTMFFEKKFGISKTRGF